MNKQFKLVNSVLKDVKSAHIHQHNTTVLNSLKISNYHRLQQCRQKCSSTSTSNIRNSNTTYTATNSNNSSNSTFINTYKRFNYNNFYSTKGHRFFSSSSFSSRYHQHQQQQQKQNNNYQYYYRSKYEKQHQQQQNNNTNNNNNEKAKLKTLGVLLSPTFLLSSNTNNIPTVAADAVEPSATDSTSTASNLLKGLFTSNNTTTNTTAISPDLSSDSMADQVTEEEPNNNNNEITSVEVSCEVDQQSENQTESSSSSSPVDINEETAADALEQFHVEADHVDEASAQNSKQILIAAAIQNPISHANDSSADSITNDENDENNNAGDSLHFHSGVCVIPHPNKRHKGGEDAHFISNDRRVLGVADGVGGWGDVGIDPSLYSNTLMEGAKLATNDTENRHPVDIMEKGYNYSQDIKGSSTCCIVVLEPDSQLLSANLGDSGFLVIRRNEVHFRTREQQHAFNMPFQLGTQSIDRPIHSITSAFEVEEGDIIVLGTDGVFDNLFDDEICRITCKHRNEPQNIARMIAKRAYEVGNSTTIFTPFAKNAGLNGYIYSGGKLDDITVIVGVVTKGPIQPLKFDVILDEDFMVEDEI